MMRKKRLTALAALLIACPLFAAGDPTPPGLPELRSDPEYAALYEEEERLRLRIGELQEEIAVRRRDLKENPPARESLTAEILALESEMLAGQTARSRTAARLRALERQWLALHPDGGAAGAEEEPGGAQVPETRQQRSLVRNDIFREYLPARDHEALRTAQEREREALARFERLRENYRQSDRIKAAYDTVRTEEEAARLLEEYRAATARGERLLDSLTELWNGIYDDKTYAYDYLLDRWDDEELIAREEKALEELRRRLAEAEAAGLRAGTADYRHRRLHLLGYELSVAEAAGLTLAADSLRGVAESFGKEEYRFPAPVFRERYFLDYEPVDFSARGRYSAKNPVPQCPVYAHGVIYRILLGEYRYRQDPSIFRNTQPLYLLRTDEGRHRYFAGGFATKEEALAAQERLRAHGFRNPEIVVWYDGDYTNLSRTPEAAAAFRIEISEAESLSERVRQTIRSEAPGCELSRAGDLFVVGRFDDRTTAERVAAAIRTADPHLQIKVAETGV